MSQKNPIWTIKDDMADLIIEIERHLDRHGCVYRGTDLHRRIQRTLSDIERETSVECFDRDDYGSGSDGW